MVESDHNTIWSTVILNASKTALQSCTSNKAAHNSSLGSVSFLSGATLDLEQTNTTL